MDEQRVNHIAIARLAGRQHGIVTVAQLAAAGVTKDAISARVRMGILHRIHRGVYAVGHRGLSNEGRWMAAVLACGVGAALSHVSAAHLWRILGPGPGPVHVTVPTGGGRKRREGICIHRSRLLSSAETTHRRGIAVTTPARTIRDLRRVASEAVVRRALREAEYQGLDLAELETDGTRSGLEAAVLTLCRRHHLPAPEVNVKVGPFTVDFLWRAAGLVVEADGYAAHRGRQAFEDDRARELYLHARGLRLRRFSARQIEHQARDVAAAIGAELRR